MLWVAAAAAFIGLLSLPVAVVLADEQQQQQVNGLTKIEDGSVISNIHTSKWRVFTDNARDLFLQVLFNSFHLTAHQNLLKNKQFHTCGFRESWTTQNDYLSVHYNKQNKVLVKGIHMLPLHATTWCVYFTLLNSLQYQYVVFAFAKVTSWINISCSS